MESCPEKAVPSQLPVKVAMVSLGLIPTGLVEEYFNDFVTKWTTRSRYPSPLRSLVDAMYVFGWPFLAGFNATPKPAMLMVARSPSSIHFLTSKVGDPKIPTGVVPVDPRLIRLGKVPGYISMSELPIVTWTGSDSTDTIRILGHTFSALEFSGSFGS